MNWHFVSFLVICCVTMTALPYLGKSTFLKALTGHLNVGSAHLEGQILYNGDPVDSGKYLVSKIADYVDEKEVHAATLTVRETLEFAWRMTSGGHHSYGTAKNAESAAFLDNGDKAMVKVRNITLQFSLMVLCVSRQFFGFVFGILHLVKQRAEDFGPQRGRQHACR